ncbi:MAG: GerAB/ArcD/ProY family transporter [Clostridium sp.]|nr:GerAB/ArcD/ProY family transporter [Clostridium sp.]
MFSCNGKISEKQMRRMLVLPAFAGCIFVLPYLSARLFGESVSMGILIFLVFACIYTACIYVIGEKYQKVMNRGGAGGKVLLLIQLLRYFIRLVFYIVLTIEVLGEAQVPFMRGMNNERLRNVLVVLPLLLVALYGAGKRIEQNARLHEMIFWVMFIPFIIMLLFGIGEVDYRVFVPQMNMAPAKIVLYAYALLTFIQPVENYLYLRPLLREGKHGAESKKRFLFPCAELLVIVLAALLSLIILGIYGVHGAGSEEMVTISIMRYIRLPFGVLERFDVLMVWFFMTGCFILICNSLYYSGHFLRRLLGTERKEEQMPNKRAGKWSAAAGLAVILLLSVGALAVVPEYSHLLMLFMCYGAVCDIPLSLLLPLAGKTIWKKSLCCIAVVLCVTMLSGCGSGSGTLANVNDMRNVEQRDYATILVISEGENGKRYHFDLGIAQEKRAGEESQREEVSSFDCNSFEELADEYQLVKGKDLSLAHLKVILFGDAGQVKEVFFNENEVQENLDKMYILEELAETFTALDENEEIAKTCPVLQLYEQEEFLDYLEDAEEPVGSYLGNLIEANRRQGKDIPWLKDYLKVIREGDSLLVYTLESVDEGWHLVCRSRAGG